MWNFVWKEMAFQKSQRFIFTYASAEISGVGKKEKGETIDKNEIECVEIVRKMWKSQNLFGKSKWIELNRSRLGNMYWRLSNNRQATCVHNSIRIDIKLDSNSKPRWICNNMHNVQRKAKERISEIRMTRKNETRGKRWKIWCRESFEAENMKMMLSARIDTHFGREKWKRSLKQKKKMQIKVKTWMNEGTWMRRRVSAREIVECRKNERQASNAFAQSECMSGRPSELQRWKPVGPGDGRSRRSKTEKAEVRYKIGEKKQTKRMMIA